MYDIGDALMGLKLLHSSYTYFHNEQHRPPALAQLIDNFNQGHHQQVRLNIRQLSTDNQARQTLHQLITNEDDRDTKDFLQAALDMLNDIRPRAELIIRTCG